MLWRVTYTVSCGTANGYLRNKTQDLTMTLNDFNVWFKQNQVFILSCELQLIVTK